MEDYKKKYENALERARGHYGVATHYNKTDEIQELEYIFPELKESEDERIRKECISIIDAWDKSCRLQGDYCEVAPKCIAWLEKQGKNEEINEASYRAGIKRVLDNPESYGLEKQREQKSAWSEEDERKITGISMVLTSWDSYHVSSADLPSLIPEYISWLNSLKERIKL